MRTIAYMLMKKQQNEDGHTWKLGIDKRLPKNLTYHNEDQIMRKSVHSLKMIRGILYRDIKDEDNAIK